MPFEDRFTVGDPYLRTKWLPLDPEISPRAQAAHPNSLARLIYALTPPMVLSPMLARLEIEIKKRRTHEKQEKNDELCTIIEDMRLPSSKSPPFSGQIERPICHWLSEARIFSKVTHR